MSPSVQSKIFLWITALLSALALFGVIPVSYDTYTETDPCPMLGVVPACYVVTVGYFLVLLSCLLSQKVLFYSGWVPVFLLAAVGSLSEIFGREVCPRSADGIPMCYVSLLFTLVIAYSFYTWNKTKKTALESHAQ